MSNSAKNPVSRFLQSMQDPAKSEVTDTQLLARFVESRDEAAFELLVRRHERLVWSVCQRVMGTHHSAEDAFQATFLTLAHKANSIREGTSIVGWLYQVAYRTSLRASSQERTKSQRVTTSDATVREHAIEADPARELSQEESFCLLHEELSRLSERHRLPVILCYLEGKSYAEAARDLNWPVGTVSTRLTQARQLLEKRLRSRGAVSAMTLLTAGALQASAPDRLFKSIVVPEMVSANASRLSTEVIRQMSTKKIQQTILGFALVLVLGASATLGILSLGRAEKPRVAPGDVTKKQFDDSPPIVVATLVSGKLESVLESFPAIYQFRIQLKVTETIQGKYKKGQTISAMHSIRAKTEPKLPIGQKFLVKLQQRTRFLLAGKLEPATDELIGKEKKLAKARQEQWAKWWRSPSTHPTFADIKKASGVMIVTARPDGGVSFTGRDNSMSIDLICVKSLRGKISSGRKFQGKVYGKQREQPKLPHGKRWLVTYEIQGNRIVLTNVLENTELHQKIAKAALK